MASASRSRPALFSGCVMVALKCALVLALDDDETVAERSDEGARRPTTRKAGGEPSPALSGEIEPVVLEQDVPVEMVVTGSRVAEQPQHAVVVTDVIDRRAIVESGARDAGEALAHQPALQLTRSFRGTEIWLRGLDPEYTLVLFDGDRMIGRSGGAIDLTRIGVERIDRIEIVRGPASALYGSDALAGVVNIIGREASGRAHGRGMVSGGGSHGASGPMLDASAWATQPVAEGLEVQADSGLHLAAPVTEDHSEVTRVSGRRQWSAYGSARYRPLSGHDVKADAEYDRQRLTGVDEGAGGARYERTQVREQVAVGASYRLRPSREIDWSTRYRGTFFREQYARDQRGSDAMDTVEDSRERLQQLTSMLAWQPSSMHMLTLGVEQLVQNLSAPRLVSSGERLRTSAFAQHTFRPWERLQLERSECDQQLGVVPGVRLDVDSQFGSQVSPKLALRYDPAPCLSLRASYGRGFRAPSFQQLLLRFENPSVGYVVTGNPELGAERSHGIDISASYAPVPELGAFIAFFGNRVRDMIATVTVSDGAGGTRFSYANLERAWTMGVEARAHIAPVRWLTGEVSYTFTSAWNGERDRPLEGVPRHRPTAMLRFHAAAWRTTARLRGSAQLGRTYFRDGVNAGGETDAGAAGERIAAAPLVTADVRVEQGIFEELEAFAGVDNLLDAGDDYAALRPRTFYAGLSGHY